MDDDIALVLGTDLRLQESTRREDDAAIMEDFYMAERRLQEQYGHMCTENIACWAVRMRMTAEELYEVGRNPKQRSLVERVMRLGPDL